MVPSVQNSAWRAIATTSFLAFQCCGEFRFGSQIRLRGTALHSASRPYRGEHIAEITRALVRWSLEQLRSLARLCTQLSDSTHLTAECLQRELRVSTADAIGIARAMPRRGQSGILRDLAVECHSSTAILNAIN